MKIAACVKHVVDETELRVDGSGRPVLQGAATKMNTFDKNAVEEALRVKSKFSGEVVLFTVGQADAKKTLKEAMAMGADRAVHVVSETPSRDSLTTSYLLAKAIQRAGGFDLILCSEGSSDAYEGQVPPMLGEWLSLPYVGYASEIAIEEGKARVSQSLETSVHSVELPLPFVASVVSEINEPRYPTLIQIMQASRKPIEDLAVAQLSGPDAPSSIVRVLDTKVQSMNRKKVLIEGSPDEAAKKLIDALRTEGVISR